MKLLLLCLLLTISLLPQAPAQENNLETTTIACWRNILAARLHIQSNRLLLYPGSASVGATSSWLWSLFDAITTNNTGYYYNPAQFNSFSSDFGMVLYQCMVINQPEHACNLNDAIVKYHNANGLYRWNKTIDQLKQDLNKAPSLSIQFDTVIYTSPIDSMVIKINANFQHILVFNAAPYESARTLAATYLPWYTYCVLQDAYEDTSSEFWPSTFGPNGFLQTISSAIIVCDNASIAMSGTSNALTFSTQSTIKQPVVQAVVVYAIKDYVQEQSATVRRCRKGKP